MKTIILLVVVYENSKKNYDNWNTYDITKYNLFITYAVGMSILMMAILLDQLFLFKNTGHDKWVLACTEGKVGYLNEPLVV